MEYNNCDAKHVCMPFIVDGRRCINCRYLNNGKWRKNE